MRSTIDSLTNDIKSDISIEETLDIELANGPRQSLVSFGFLIQSSQIGIEERQLSLQRTLARQLMIVAQMSRLCGTINYAHLWVLKFKCSVISVIYIKTLGGSFPLKKGTYAILVRASRI